MPEESVEEVRGARAPSFEGYRCGYVALAGRPNVGKSTLLNALVGQHLSIVSELAQTTRERVSGIWSDDEAQLIFLDTPGLLEPGYALQEAMRWAADEAIREADVLVLVCDATRPATLPDEDLIAGIGSESDAPLLIVLNKCDVVAGDDLRELLDSALAGGAWARPVSALTGEGLDELRSAIIAHLPESPPLYPQEYTAVRNLRFFTEEFVRETCMQLFREEVPYSIACRVDEFREDRDPIYIRMTIYVERESQKGIVVGRGGRAIKRVGKLSRQKIEELLGSQVYLDLRVKVLPRWSRKRGRLRHLGFRLP